jgi:PAS domain S-box-containing protein
VKINYTPMALNTAVVFVLLVIGVVNAHPGFPLRRLGVSNSAAGVAVRRLLPAAIGFTFVAGWLIHVAVAHAAYFSEPVGLALFAAVSMSGLSALILWSAGVFDEADADRNRIYAEVLRLNAELEERVEVRTAELRRASAYMRSLIEASLDPLVTISAEGKITDVNSAAVRATGAPRESLLGSDFSAYFTEPDQAHAGYQAVFAKGEVRDYPLALQHASGKVIEVLFNASVFRNEWGEAEGVFAAARDITDLKRGAEALRKRTEELDSFFNLSLDMLCIANTGGYFTRLNPAWECTLGYAIAELMQRPFYDFVHPEDLASTREVVAGLASQKELVNFGNRYRCKDGSYRWFEWNASAVGERIYASARDITERKLAEKALHRLNRELRAISNCNQALMRADDEQTLLNDVCRVICEEADDRMLWVGYAENADGRTIHPVAWAGFDSGHLSDAKPTWAKGVERGQGPAGKTIQSGETVYVHDFTADPQMTPWRQSALARGYRSGIALPLKGESARAFGALVMYSSDINGINPDEIRLLEELARALSFGIIALRTRIKRNQAENIMQARLRLMEFSSSHTMDELLSAALDEIESLTGSNIGFYHFVEPDQKTLSLQSWSSNTLKGVCTAEGKGFHYDVAEAGQPFTPPGASNWRMRRSDSGS